MTASFRDSPLEARAFVPQVKYIFISLEEIPDEKLLELSDFSLLGAAMLLMKKADDHFFLTHYLSSFFNFLENRTEWNHFFYIFVEYLKQRSPLTPAEWEELSNKNLSPYMKAQVMTAFETTAQIERREARAEAKAETLKESVERFLLKKKFSDIDIAEGLDMPISLVYSIKEKLIQSGQLKA